MRAKGGAERSKSVVVSLQSSNQDTQADLAPKLFIGKQVSSIVVDLRLDASQEKVLL
jgi:hypothetical protein